MSEPVPAGTFLKPISAALARVLGQAANSAYAPPTFYVVARYERAETTTRPFNVQKPVETYEEAEELVRRLKATEPNMEYGIFGPFLNPHVPGQGEPATVGQATVDKLDVTLTRGEQRLQTRTIEGHEYDALFYSFQAVEKFVVPYYVQHYGAEFGLDVLNSFRNAEVALMGHLPWSEEIQYTPMQNGASNAEPRPHGPTSYALVLFESDGNGVVRPRELHPPEG